MTDSGSGTLVGVNGIFNTHSSTGVDTWSWQRLRLGLPVMLMASQTFVIGGEERVYNWTLAMTLSQRTEADFALITDFDPSQDFIELSGSAELYSLDFFTSASGTIDADLIFDPGIEAVGEVIATLQNISADLSFGDSAFIFV